MFDEMLNEKETFDKEIEADPLGEVFEENDMPENEFLDDTDMFEEKMNSTDVFQEIKSIVDENIQPLTLPKSHGHWSGEIGNSEFIMDDDYIPSGRGINSEGLTMQQIKEKYDFDGIEYINKEPDFSRFADKDIGAITVDEFSSERQGEGGTYTLAASKAAEQLNITSSEVEKMMKERGLTWHECGDRKTILPIPSEINAAYKHSGGISIDKNINAFSDYLDDTYGHLALDRDTPFPGEQDVDLDIDAARKQIRKDVKAHRDNK